MAVKMSVLGALAQAFAEPVTVSTANTGSDGSGTLASLHTASGNGSVVTSVLFTAQVTTTAGMLRIYFYDGATARLIAEVPVTAYVKSATQQGFTYSWAPGGGSLTLPPGTILKASTHNAEAFTALTIGTDY